MAIMNNTWNETAKNLWDAVLSRARLLREEEGYTYQQLADLLGLSHRAKVSDWLHGHQKAENATFADLMRYVEALGIDYREYFPHREKDAAAPSQDAGVEEMKRRLVELERAVRELEPYRIKWEGHLEELAVMHGHAPRGE